MASLLIFFNGNSAPLKSKTGIEKLTFFSAQNSKFQYIGRIDFRNKKLPRFWSPGVYISAKFKGTYCELIINDQELWGKNHNYLEIVIDNIPSRIITKEKNNHIVIAKGLSNTAHTLVICKNTESNIGYLEFVGIKCSALLSLPPKPVRTIECIGNSITCGTGSDQSEIPCGKGVWQDQHNAYLSYGPTVARNFNAQYHLSAVSGIGLMHSCCGMNIVMPAVFNKIDMRGDSLIWDFTKYQPDIVTICLGQNDGIQDSVIFCSAYINFIGQVRTAYAKAELLLLSSPMGDENLTRVLKNYLSAIKTAEKNSGEKNIETYFFSKQYHEGCDSHPSVAEHQLIAGELNIFIKKIMKW